MVAEIGKDKLLPEDLLRSWRNDLSLRRCESFTSVWP
jgi:hypothetical protein